MCCLDPDEPSRWLQPLPARLLQRRASSWLLAGYRLQLEQTIRREIGSINQLSKMFNICFAPGLICTNLIPLQKEPFLQCAPEGPLNAFAFLTVDRRCCSELQAAGSSQPRGLVSSLPGQAGGAGPGRWGRARGNSGQESGSCSPGGSAFLATGTWGAGEGGVHRLTVEFPVDWSFLGFLRALFAGSLLLSFLLHGLYMAELSLTFRVACIAGLYKIILSEHTSKIAFINILYLLRKDFSFEGSR